MRIRRKFSLVFTVLICCFFVLLYIWINFALPDEKRRGGDYDEFLPKNQRQKPSLLIGNNVHQRQVKIPAHHREEKQHIDSQDLIKDSVIQVENNWNSENTGECSLKIGTVPSPDIQMLDIYRGLSFDNPDGGVWKQGWNIEYDPKEWNSHHKLKVFVVPHSHNDPGWLKTFEQYYQYDTKPILTNMLRHLSENEDMKFIWAEISYFSKWYESISDESKKELKRIIQRKQLEFVTGGWVMNDEANSHWLSILQQVTEGQKWLQLNLNITPTAHWSIDPFGYSPTNAYIMKEIGLKNMLIQRVHYSIKKKFAQQRSLEFIWRQIWDTTGDTGIFTHLMPFYSYDVPHTCGPDPKVCCQFDFKRLPGFGLNCPWRVPPKAIDDFNVAKKAELIVDQWRKKSVLYQTRSVLIPLGDDFRYSQSTEWLAQMTNYRKLFDFINNEPGLNVEAKFATLQEYFDSVEKEKSFPEFPSFSGDFFTYADKDDNYWSGYYTSRPYHKRLDRVLMGYLRSAEMIHSWNSWDPKSGLETKLENGRRALSLFQHHDGITGTAKDFVVTDYEEIMSEALKDLKFVIQQSAYRILTKPSIYEPDYNYEYFNIDDSRSPRPDENRPTIIIGSDIPQKHVVLHNSLPYEREELVDFYVARPFVMVLDSSENPIPCQISPVWTWHKGTYPSHIPQASTTKFKVSFKASVPPFGLKVYIIQSTKDAESSHLATFATVTIFTESPWTINLGEYPKQVEFSSPKEMSLHLEETGQGASFNKNGFLKSISSGGNSPSFPAHLEFLKYGVTKGAEHSGAYLFIPNGPAEKMRFNNPTVLVSKGSLESFVGTGLPFGVHQVFLKEDGLEIRNIADISDYPDTEVVMRISTGIANEDYFYTDLNGLQIIKRQRFEKLPIQANYYPIPSSLFIEDKNQRLTLLSAQPLGGSSLSSGEIEIMQDRRLLKDDNRGVGQGVMDNRPTLHVFKLILESRESCSGLDPAHPSGFLTINAHSQMQNLLYPMDKLVFQGNDWSEMLVVFGESRESFRGFDVPVIRSLPFLKSKSGDSAQGIVIHRTQFDFCSDSANQEGVVNVRKMLDIDESTEIHESTMTLLKRKERVLTEEVSVCPMDTKALIISR